MRTVFALLTCFFASLALGGGATTATADLPVVDQYTEQPPTPGGQSGVNGGGSTPGTNNGGSSGSGNGGSGNGSNGSSGSGSPDVIAPPATSGSQSGGVEPEPAGSSGSPDGTGSSGKVKDSSLKANRQAVKHASVAGISEGGMNWWFPILMIGVAAGAVGLLIARRRGEGSRSS